MLYVVQPLSRFVGSPSISSLSAISIASALEIYIRSCHNTYKSRAEETGVHVSTMEESA